MIRVTNNLALQELGQFDTGTGGEGGRSFFEEGFDALTRVRTAAQGPDQPRLHPMRFGAATMASRGSGTPKADAFGGTCTEPRFWVYVF
jgi:hypothetical protein